MNTLKKIERDSNDPILNRQFLRGEKNESEHQDVFCQLGVNISFTNKKNLEKRSSHCPSKGLLLFKM